MDLKYCPGCGENVETFIKLQIDSDNLADVQCCIHCDMRIEDISQERPTVVGTVMLSEDSPMMREMLKDAIINNHLAKEVVTSKQGADFLSQFTGMAIEKKEVSMVVLDVTMPIFNGVNAAIALRAVEKAFKIKPTPIMFFTAHKCDERFKKLLHYCKPALYLNKGSSSTPEALSGRISKVFLQLGKARTGMERKTGKRPSEANSLKKRVFAPKRRAAAGPS